MLNYDPTNQYDVESFDVTYRHGPDGAIPARIYQPRGDGPFPAVLDVHGGAWNRGDYLDNQRIDHALAASGLVVAAIEFRQAPAYKYPTQVADVNFGTRWLKAHAQEFNADVRQLGGLGTSSGGHTMMLSAMRPHDPRYASLDLPEAAGLDATLAYVLAAWPVLDSYARYCFAKDQGNESLMSATEAYFVTEDAMKEGNPQLILERGEAVELPPTLIVQGTADNNVPLSVSERFEASYRAAGGSVERELFPNMPHGFARDAGAEADRAIDLMKAFVARQLAALNAVV